MITDLMFLDAKAEKDGTLTATLKFVGAETEIREFRHLKLMAVGAQPHCRPDQDPFRAAFILTMQLGGGILDQPHFQVVETSAEESHDFRSLPAL